MTDPKNPEKKEDDAPLSIDQVNAFFDEQRRIDDDDAAARKARHAELFPDLDEDEDQDKAGAELRALNARMAAELLRIEGELAQARGETERLNGLLQTQKSDTANMERRLNAQIAAARDAAIGKFAQDLLPVMDALESGLGLITPEERAADKKFDKLAIGFEKTAQRLRVAFNKHGIREINPQDEPVDTNLHEIIGVRTAEDKDDDTVLSVESKGYAVNGSLIRPARVIINGQ